MANFILLVLTLMTYTLQLASGQTYAESYHPQYQFTPAKSWMNNPNGLLYHNGVYHIYYQYNPGGNTWGNISWGHATSHDLIYWQQQPIALLARGYPQTITEMFLSGSAVVDAQNTSGFGMNGTIPFVAIYTSYYPTSEDLPSGKSVLAGQQAQSIAYSLDEGMTWTTYDVGNPVIAVPPAPYADQYEKFRDPFIFWHELTRDWVLVVSLAKINKLLIYTSKNLRDWIQVSEFGPLSTISAAWECPSIFPLPLDGDEANVVWVAQIRLNPSGLLGTTGSGTHSVLGTFDGTTFLAETTSSAIVFQDFEGNGTLDDLGWTATGGFIGTKAAQGTLVGQNPVTGYLGTHLVNTFLNGDATTGTLSTTFNITRRQISFLIGGGNFPNQECINLLIQGQVVRTATGSNSEQLVLQSWDVTEFLGQSAAIEIVDLLTVGWGHILIDQITFSDSLIEEGGASRVDWSPEFYAATSFNGPSLKDRLHVSWMNKSQYDKMSPTSAWRSGMSLPRILSLHTINEKPTLVQQPAESWDFLEITGSYSRSWSVVPEGDQTLQLSGKALGITMIFFDRPPTSPSSEFGLILRATSDLTQQIRVGYEFNTKRLFIDKMKSGNVVFDNTLPSVYYAPLMPDNGGIVSIHVLLDWSSVEVFGGQGEVTLAAQVFPHDNGTDVRVFSTGGDTSGVTIRAKAVGSAWQGVTTKRSSSSHASTNSSVSSPSGTFISSSSSSATVMASSSAPTAAYDFRPTYHFCPEEYWMNEPNGLIKINSTWHLFFQHNPTGNFWGDLSWGHSTSTDLIHWQYLPVALPAEDNIQCFTGTSWYDAENLSGLGTTANPPYLAFYTGYSPSTGVQDQRLAYSSDHGANYVKLVGNPIISQAQETPHDITGGLEARDPKVFFYTPTGTWVMILAHGGQNKVTFWTSTDAKEWSWTSDLSSGDIPGFPSAATGWEVPDFFELPIEGTGLTTWVLIFTPANGSPAGGNGVVGITGSFNGTVFTADPVVDTTLWLDYGRDWDGAMSWENLPASDGRRILAAVMNSYGTNPPTNTWKGMLSFPRELTLKELNGRLTFLQQPIVELSAISTSIALVTNQTLAPGQKLLSTIYGKALDIRIFCIPATGSTLTLGVRVGGTDQTVIRYVQSSGQLQVDRTSSGDISYDPAAGGIHSVTLQPDTNEVVQLRVLVDECSVEAFGGEGQVVISDLIFPSATSSGIYLSTAGGNVTVQSLEVFVIEL